MMGNLKRDGRLKGQDGKWKIKSQVIPKVMISKAGKVR